MRVACLMMQKNEEHLLRAWLTYHSYLFGPRNLFVFDNGSDSARCRAVLEEFAIEGVHCDFSKNSKADFQDKGRVIGDAILDLDLSQNFDFFVPLDCDEFFCLEDVDHQIVADRKKILTHLKQFIGVQDVLQIKGSYYNVLGKPAWYYFYKERASFFSAGTFKSIDLGFHYGRSRLSPDERETEIVHLHYSNKPFDILLSHAREKLSTRVADFQPATLQSYTGAGSHMIPFFFMTESQYQESLFSREDLVHTRALIDRLTELGCKDAIF